MGNDDLGYKPPTDDIPDSQYGQYVKDGPHPVKITGYRLHEDGRNAWIDCEITGGEGKGELFSMNMYLPTQANLNDQLNKKGSKEEALKAFFHYKQTLKAAGIPLDLSIQESLDKLLGWTGTALFLNQEGYRTKVQMLQSKETAAATSKSSGEPF